MEIEVVIAEWEQACCGAPFQLGERVSWHLVALPPETGALPRFERDDHELTPNDVPHWPVAGTVAAITGIRFPDLPIAGEPNSYTRDTSAPEFHSLTSVGEPDALDLSEYRVTLQLADETDLPAHVTSADQIAQQAVEIETHERNLERMLDPVGLLLEALADDAQERYPSIAQTVRATDRSAFSVTPLRPNAVSVHWDRSEEETDSIHVLVGNGRWDFPASVAHAEIVRVLLEAAVRGWVEEHLRRQGAVQLLETEVIAQDDRSWTATETVEVFEADGFFAVPGGLWDRVQRGNHRYDPWAEGLSSARADEPSPSTP
jgi:hypothetical protein